MLRRSSPYLASQAPKVIVACVIHASSSSFFFFFFEKAITLLMHSIFDISGRFQILYVGCVIVAGAISIHGSALLFHALVEWSQGWGASAENDSMGGFYITPPFFVGQSFRQKEGFHIPNPPPPFFG